MYTEKSVAIISLACRLERLLLEEFIDCGACPRLAPNRKIGRSIPGIPALHPSGPLRGVESFPTIQSNHFEASFAVRLLRMY